MITRKVIDDGRMPDLLTGMPLETDAEYRERIFGAAQITAASHKAPINAIAEAMPFGVKFSISELQEQFTVNVETDRNLSILERKQIVDAAQAWMRMPGFDITFSVNGASEPAD